MAHAEGAASAEPEPATCGHHAGADVFTKTRSGSGAGPDAGRGEWLNGGVLIFNPAGLTEHTLSDQTGC